MTDLERRLRDRGLPYRVEARDRLAILIPDGGAALDHRRRGDLVTLARQVGFTHVALELDPDGASLSRD